MKKNHLQKGFGLIEVMFACTALIMVIVAVFALQTKSLQLSSLAKQKTVAYGLAQQSIEYIHKLRDNCVTGLDTCDFNAKANGNLFGYGPITVTNGIVTTDFKLDNITYTTTSTLDDTAASTALLTTYKQSTLGIATGGYLSRHIKKINVTVKWTSNGDHSIALSTFLSDWQTK